MEILISNHTSKPIYEQIADQIKGLIMSGERAIRRREVGDTDQQPYKQTDL